MGKAKSETERRRRRRHRRIQVIILYTAIAVGLAWFFESQATTTVIFVRHAEKTAEPVDDPSLSPAGHQRAAELARQLKFADVVDGIDAIYSTPYQRTVDTAKPVAAVLGLPITSYDANDTEKIMEDIVRKHKGKIVLVIGHSNTLPALIGNMGASKKVPVIDENEYDNIYIVSIPWFGKTKTIRLLYGDPYVPPVAAQ